MMPSGGQMAVGIVPIRRLAPDELAGIVKVINLFTDRWNERELDRSKKLAFDINGVAVTQREGDAVRGLLVWFTWLGVVVAVDIPRWQAWQSSGSFLAAPWLRKHVPTERVTGATLYQEVRASV